MSIDFSCIITGHKDGKYRYLKTCDSCSEKSEVTRYDGLKSRDRHNGKDYCLRCACKIKNSGKGNPAKRKEVRRKISAATKGKSKSFKDGKNLRRLGIKQSTNGYLLEWDDSRQRYIPQHRLVVEKHLGRLLVDEEQVHHINGNKVDNSIENLWLCSTPGDHTRTHKQLETIAFQAYTLGLVEFDCQTGRYFISAQVQDKSMRVSLGFEDVSILQGKNICESRSDVNIDSEVIRDVIRPIPLIAANMSSVTNADFCIALYKAGALGVLHRAANYDWMLSETQKIAKSCEHVAVSIGVGDKQFDLAKRMISVGANIIVIDIAHGYCDAVINLGKRLKRSFPHCKVVVGNTINADMIYEVYEFCDAIKIGIAQGQACETKDTAGCTEKQFSAIRQITSTARKFNIPLISDGGVRLPGDFTKAILGGADAVMAGGIFARCPESAAEIVYQDSKPKKVYSGMASRDVQNQWRGGLKEGTCPEGKTVYLDLGESLESLLTRYSGALRSGITYVGAKNISDARDQARFIRIAR